MPLLRAEWLDKVYTFPQTLQEYHDNFGELHSQTVRVISADGGFDGLQTGRAPVTIGRIVQELFLSARSRAGMETKRDALKAMLWWPVHRLYMQPGDPALAERWAWVRLVDIRITKREEGHTDFFQPVTLVWEASDPHWYSIGTENPARWGMGYTWGAGSSNPTVWGGSLGKYACSGIETTLTIEPAGNQPTFPVITIRPDTGDTCTNPTISRYARGYLVDQMRWEGALNPHDILVIDTRRQTVKMNSGDAYDAFSSQRLEWLELQPGENSIVVNFENLGDAANVRFAYYDTWG